MNSLLTKIQKFLREDPLLHRVLKNTGYLFSSNTISLVLVFFQSILAARLLGAEVLGLITIVMSFVTNINRLFSFRMGEFVIRYFGKYMAEGNLSKASAAIKAAALAEGSTSILAFGFLFLLAPLGAQIFAKDPNSLYLFKLFSFAIFANLITETSNGILQVTNQYKKQAAISLIQAILTAVLITIAFFTQGNIVNILWAYLVGKIFLGVSPIVLAARTLKRELGKNWWRVKFSLLPSLKEMVSFAVSTNLSGTIKLVVSESEPLWIGLFLDKQAVGIYKIAWGIVNPLMMPISPMINTTFPEITRSIVTKKWSQLKQMLRRVTYLSGGWTVFVTAFMLVFGKWIISLAYGADFVPAYSVLMILLAGFGISNIFFWNRTLLLSFGKANIPLYVLFGAAVLKILLAFLLVPMYGINAEAALLSGNFALSVGLLVWIGLTMVKRAEKLDTLETA
jgi:O-antigen/teichoic acid export membrane protein